MTHQTHPSDQRIDLALHSLRDTHPPTGLEARIAARLAQAVEASAITEPRAAVFPPFAVIARVARAPRILLAHAPLYTLAATALMAITLIVVNHHKNPTPLAHSNAQPAPNSIQPSILTKASNLTKTFAPANNQAPQGLSLGSHRLSSEKGTLAPASDDPDTLALAETLAPSHPAPPMPLTAQEHLLLLATRPGQPMELAELETLRQPAIQAAAEARERATIRRYAQSLLAPLAAAEALNPTSPPPSSDAVPTSEPPSSR